MSNSTRDINAPSTFSSNGTGTIYVAHKGTNTLFNEKMFSSTAQVVEVELESCTGNGTAIWQMGNPY
ncbi:MAG: hypothetical protein IPJ86_05450 [Bacteroidetes bacterium]|nr:hypothetical protein [Bacteroidota bacterium]